MNILVIEDDRISRTIIENFLTELGHTVTGVETADEGWRLFLNNKYRIVFTDWRMPGMSGLEFCRRVRDATKDGSYTYVVMLTSNENRIAGLSAGADDFITKPFDPDELRFRLNNGLRVLDLEERLEKQVEIVEKSRLDLAATHQRLRRELNAAAELQRTLLPVAPEPSDPFNYAWSYEPSADLGGDYFNIRKLSPNRYGFIMTDVCGHGVKPALLAVTLHYLMDTRLRHCPLLWSDTDVNPDSRAVPPLQVLSRLNQQFPTDAEVTQYFTMFYGVLDTNTGEFRYSTAGHPPPVLIPAEGDVRWLAGCGVPVGLHEDPDFEEQCVTLQPGDRLLMFSDGAIESKNSNGDMVGTKHILLWAEEGRQLGVEALTGLISANIQAWTCQSQPRDDISILVFEYQPVLSRSPSLTETPATAVMRRV